MLLVHRGGRNITRTAAGVSSFQEPSVLGSLKKPSPEPSAQLGSLNGTTVGKAILPDARLLQCPRYWADSRFPLSAPDLSSFGELLPPGFPNCCFSMEPRAGSPCQPKAQDFFSH